MAASTLAFAALPIASCAAGLKVPFLLCLSLSIFPLPSLAPFVNLSFPVNPGALKTEQGMHLNAKWAALAPPSTHLCCRPLAHGR